MIGLLLVAVLVVGVHSTDCGIAGVHCVPSEYASISAAVLAPCGGAPCRIILEESGSPFTESVSITTPGYSDFVTPGEIRPQDGENVIWRGVPGFDILTFSVDANYWKVHSGAGSSLELDLNGENQNAIYINVVSVGAHEINGVRFSTAPGAMGSGTYIRALGDNRQDGLYVNNCELSGSLADGTYVDRGLYLVSYDETSSSSAFGSHHVSVVNSTIFANFPYFVEAVVLRIESSFVKSFDAPAIFVEGWVFHSISIENSLIHIVGKSSANYGINVRGSFSEFDMVGNTLVCDEGLIMTQGGLLLSGEVGNATIANNLFSGCSNDGSGYRIYESFGSIGNKLMWCNRYDGSMRLRMLSSWLDWNDACVGGGQDDFTLLRRGTEPFPYFAPLQSGMIAIANQTSLSVDVTGAPRTLPMTIGALERDQDPSCLWGPNQYCVPATFPTISEAVEACLLEENEGFPCQIYLEQTGSPFVESVVISGSPLTNDNRTWSDDSFRSEILPSFAATGLIDWVGCVGQPPLIFNGTAGAWKIHPGLSGASLQLRRFGEDGPIVWMNGISEGLLEFRDLSFVADNATVDVVLRIDGENWTGIVVDDVTLSTVNNGSIISFVNASGASELVDGIRHQIVIRSCTFPANSAIQSNPFIGINRAGSVQLSRNSFELSDEVVGVPSKRSLIDICNVGTFRLHKNYLSAVGGGTSGFRFLQLTNVAFSSVLFNLFAQEDSGGRKTQSEYFLSIGFSEEQLRSEMEVEMTHHIRHNTFICSSLPQSGMLLLFGSDHSIFDPQNVIFDSNLLKGCGNATVPLIQEQSCHPSRCLGGTGGVLRCNRHDGALQWLAGGENWLKETTMPILCAGGGVDSWNINGAGDKPNPYYAPMNALLGYDDSPDLSKLAMDDDIDLSGRMTFFSPPALGALQDLWCLRNNYVCVPSEYASLGAAADSCVAGSPCMIILDQDMSGSWTVSADGSDDPQSPGEIRPAPASSVVISGSTSWLLLTGNNWKIHGALHNGASLTTVLSSGGTRLNSANNIEISEFVFDSHTYGIDLSGTFENVTVRDSVFHSGRAIFVTGVVSLPSLPYHRLVFEGNTILNGVVDWYVIELDDIRNVLIERNYFAPDEYYGLMKIEGDTRDVEFYNNIVASAYNSKYIFSHYDQVNYITVRHNTFAVNPDYFVRFDNGMPDIQIHFIFENNLLKDTTEYFYWPLWPSYDDPTIQLRCNRDHGPRTFGPGSKSWTIDDSCDGGGDNLPFDFTLSGSQPVPYYALTSDIRGIDRLSDVPTDFLGRIRPNPPTIGALEIEFVCFGKESGTGLECGGEGRCVAKDNCLCTDYGKWKGQECTIPVCFLVDGDSPDACSSNGTCIAPDVCVCAAEDRYTGERCHIPVCWDIPSTNVSDVCSGGNGICVGWDECVCDPSMYRGPQCEVSVCWGLAEDDPDVCSFGNGTCISHNECACLNSSKYWGEQCNETFCMGMSGTNDAVCSGHGSCFSYDVCVCSNPAEWTGQWCDFPVCHAQDMPVLGWRLGCNLNGTCVAPDFCLCDNFGMRYNGSKCDVPVCDGIMADLNDTCNGRGSCEAPDLCECYEKSLWTGPLCDFPICDGFDDWISTDLAGGCNSSGMCVGPDQCNCFNESVWAGHFCDVAVCNDVLSNDNATCFGEGTCLAPDVCLCDAYDQWTGAFCDYPICGGFDDWESRNLTGGCNLAGTCIAPDQCSCFSSAIWIGQLCEIPVCNMIPANDSFVCNNSTCIAPGQCDCRNGTTGQWCEDYICYNLMPDDPTQCNYGNGSCTAPDRCECSNPDRWTGYDCSFPVCNNQAVEGLGVRLGCHFNGTCIAPDVCSCDDESKYRGQLCDIPVCWTYPADQPFSTCSGNGWCIAHNSCDCYDDSVFTGTQCEIPVCSGILQTDDRVCNHRNGTCDAGTCVCDDFLEWGGQECAELRCNGVPASDSLLVCNEGRGRCDSLSSDRRHICTCDDPVKWRGEYCETELPVCSSFASDNPNACAMHGTCVGDDACDCDEGWGGDASDYRAGLASDAPMGSGIWVEDFCGIPLCYGELASSLASVCGSHGYCVGIDQCVCEDGWEGEMCHIVSETTFSTGTLATVGVVPAILIGVVCLIVLIVVVVVVVILALRSRESENRVPDKTQESELAESEMFDPRKTAGTDRIASDKIQQEEGGKPNETSDEKGIEEFVEIEPEDSSSYEEVIEYIEEEVSGEEEREEQEEDTSSAEEV